MPIEIGGGGGEEEGGCFKAVLSYDSLDAIIFKQDEGGKR
jgi:hypothetical protein